MRFIPAKREFRRKKNPPPPLLSYAFTFRFYVATNADHGLGFVETVCSKQTLRLNILHIADDIYKASWNIILLPRLPYHIPQGFLTEI